MVNMFWWCMAIPAYSSQRTYHSSLAFFVSGQAQHGLHLGFSSLLSSLLSGIASPWGESNLMKLWRLWKQCPLLEVVKSRLTGEPRGLSATNRSLPVKYKQNLFCMISAQKKGAFPQCLNKIYFWEVIPICNPEKIEEYGREKKSLFSGGPAKLLSPKVQGRSWLVNCNTTFQGSGYSRDS